MAKYIHMNNRAHIGKYAGDCGLPTEGHEMRTNIEIEDELMAAAMNCGSFRTKRAAVEAGLRLLVRTKAQESIRSLRGTLSWEGSLDEMRADR